MPKLTKDETIFENYNEKDYECVDSFNSHNCVTSETKLIIVGTITPSKGKENGYFYTAPRNLVYGYIDDALGTNLKKKKELLKIIEDKANVIFQIVEELKENKIAFLDIMKKAIRKKDSYKDTDILFYSLDIESFRNVPENVYFICNSKLAKEGLEEICKELNRNIVEGINYHYRPQRLYSTEQKENRLKWIEEIRNHI